MSDTKIDLSALSTARSREMNEIEAAIELMKLLSPRIAIKDPDDMGKKFKTILKHVCEGRDGKFD